jgi:hypothetical protein
VGGGGQPGADADSYVDEKSAGDGETANKIVHPIGDQN